VVSLPAIETEHRFYQLSDDPEDVYERVPGEVLHPAREPLEILEQIRRSQGSLTFSAQYQQAPVPPEGNVIRREWLRYYVDAPSSFDMVIASWDTASTLSDEADYSVGTVWGAKGLDFFLLDRIRGRYEIPELRRQVIRAAQKWNTDQVVIEATDTGRALMQDLRRSGPIRPIVIPPRYGKEARFLAQSARFESGQVHVASEAPWLAEWLHELLAFPNGRHDDQVDSTSQALSYLSSRMFSIERDKQPRERPKRKRRPVGYPFRQVGVATQNILTQRDSASPDLQHHALERNVNTLAQPST
jgi:predicted phage terminase large subunit-like protein